MIPAWHRGEDKVERIVVARDTNIDQGTQVLAAGNAASNGSSPVQTVSSSKATKSLALDAPVSSPLPNNMASRVAEHLKGSIPLWL